MSTEAKRICGNCQLFKPDSSGEQRAWRSELDIAVDNLLDTLAQSPPELGEILRKAITGIRSPDFRTTGYRCDNLSVTGARPCSFPDQFKPVDNT